MKFWFDDGYGNDYSEALPFLIDKKCTGIVALVTDLVCEPEYMCTKKIMALMGCGWEIASHGTNHKSMLEMSRNETREVLADSKAWIKEHLGVVPEIFVAPWNVLREEQRELALEYYKEVRSPETLHFHSNNMTDVVRTITQILCGGPEEYTRIEKKRYLKTQKVIKNRFGVDV